MVIALLFAVTALVFDHFTVFIPAGILIGSLLSVYKIRLNSRLLAGAVQSGSPTRKGLVVQFLSQFMVFGVLLATVLVNLRLFAGVAIGILLVPLYICINAITERLGITHNAWGES